MKQGAKIRAPARRRTKPGGAPRAGKRPGGPEKTFGRTGSVVPCSQWAHSRCPAHKYWASLVFAVLDQTRRSDRTACAIRIAASGQGTDRIRPGRATAARLVPSGVGKLAVAPPAPTLIGVARPRWSPSTGSSGPYPGGRDAPAQSGLTGDPGVVGRAIRPCRAAGRISRCRLEPSISAKPWSLLTDMFASDRL